MTRTSDLMLDISVCWDEIHDLQVQLDAAYEGLADLEDELGELEDLECGE